MYNPNFKRYLPTVSLGNPMTYYSKIHTKNSEQLKVYNFLIFFLTFYFNLFFSELKLAITSHRVTGFTLG